MYKTHCQCILDTAINANFDEVGSCVHVPVTQLLWKLDFVSALFANVQESLALAQRIKYKTRDSRDSLCPTFPALSDICRLH